VTMADEDRIDLSMFLGDYLDDAREGFQRINAALLALERDQGQTEHLDEVFRDIHSLKSASAMLEFAEIAELAHSCEDLLDRLRKQGTPANRETLDILFEVTDALQSMVLERSKGKSSAGRGQGLASRLKALASEGAYSLRAEAEQGPRATRTSAVPAIENIQTVRVHFELLDALFNLAGELIINKNRIDNIASNTADKELKAALASMEHIISELHETVSVARLVPVGEVFEKFPRMVRDLAKEAGKEIELVVEGSEIEMDKAVLDTLSEPLIHLVKNAVDHGIEPAEAREGRNKKRAGTIRLAARRAENHILIDVEDDGGGVDTARMKEVAVEGGLLKAEDAEHLQDRDVLDLLFEPGVTSAEKVTDVSGRGVGLDVVRNSAKQLGGTVEVTTQKGKGTHFTLTLPLTTAVLQTLMVGVGSHVFAIPAGSVLETLEVKAGDIKEIGDGQALVLRREAIPFVKLGEVLNLPEREDQNELVAVVVHIGDRLLSLGVDDVLDQTDAIVKPFDPIAQGFRGFSGGTILGDGSVALLIDIPGLLSQETVVRKRRHINDE